MNRLNNSFLGNLSRRIQLFMLSLCAGICLNLNGQQKDNCPLWMPTIADVQYPKLNIKTPVVAPMLNAAKLIDDMMHNNAAFNSIPRARRRTKYGLLVDSLYGLLLHVKAYHERAWDDKCGVIPQADRIAADEAGVTFKINSPMDFMPNQFDNVNGYLQKINAFVVPEYIGELPAGAKIYRSGVTKQEFALITYNGKVPWRPLTLAEYLETYETKLKVKRADFEQERKRQSEKKPYQFPQEYYESLKKRDPKQAEKFKADMDKVAVDYNKGLKQMDRIMEKGDSTLQAEMREFLQYKASLSKEQLQQQAILSPGDVKYNLWREGSTYPKMPLVTVAPDFKTNPTNRNAIRYITIWQGGNKWAAYARKAWETVDYPLLNTLFR